MIPSRSRLWRDRDFLHLWLAQSVSAFGARITREGLPIAAILGLGASSAQVGLLAGSAHAAALAVGLTAGGHVDRNRRRGIMMAADLVRALVLVTAPIAALLHLLTLPQLYVTAALVAAASVLFEIADHAYLPSLVAREDLTGANASLSGTESVAEIAGPALAGLLFQFLAAPLALAANAATYLISAGFLSGIRKPEPAPTPQPDAHWRADIAMGFGAAWRHALVRPVLLMSSVHALFGGIFSALYILFCLKVVGLSPGPMGATIAVGGLGALVGAGLAGALSRRLGVGPAILAALVLVAVSVAAIPMAPADPKAGMAVLMVSQFFGDASGVAVLILTSSVRQSVLPGEVLGRVGAAFHALGGGLALVGAVGGGLLGESLGVRGALAVAAAGFAAAPVLGVLSPIRQLREIPAEVS